MKLKFINIILIFNITLIIIILTSVRNLYGEPDVIILNDSFEKQTIGFNIEYFEDKDKRLSIKDIASKDILWKKSDKESLGIGFTASAYWVRFIKNKSSKQNKWLLELSYPMMDKISLFITDKNGKFIEKVGGDQYKFNKRDIKYRNVVFTLNLDKNQKASYYMKFTTEGSMNIPLIIWHPFHFYNYQSTEQIFLGLYYGGMIVMIIYGFLLFLGMRYRSYIYYVLFLISYVLIQLTFNGLAFQYLWPNLIEWANICLPFFIFICTIFINLFNKTFLNTNKYTPVFDKIIFGMVIFGIVGIPFSLFIGYKIMVQIAAIYVIITVILMLTNSYKSLLKGYRPARIYVIAWTFFLFGAAVYVLKSFGVLPNNQLTNMSSQIGSVIVAIGLSLSQVDQIYILRKEKTDALNRLNQAYSRFVPHEFLQLLEKDSVEEIQLGDQILKYIAIFFADIRSFTTLSETMSPEENFNFLNSYLKRISPIIRKHNGFIDKFIGDAIMAIFPDDPENSLKASIEIQNALKEYNSHRTNSGYDPIAIGIGLHCGSVMLGTVGEQKRIDGTVIADTVNLASRIESLTKTFSASILVSEDIISNLHDHEYNTRSLGRVKVKGKNKKTSIIEILDGCNEEEKELKLKTKDDFEIGIQYYFTKKYNKSYQYLNKVIKVNPNDKAANYFLDRLNKKHIPDNNYIVDD